MRRWRNRNQCSHPPYDAGEDGLLSLCNGFARSTILTLLPLSNFASLCGYYLRLVPVGRCLPAYPTTALSISVPPRYKTSQKREANVMPPPMSLARPLGPPVQRMKRPSEQNKTMKANVGHGQPPPIRAPRTRPRGRTQKATFRACKPMKTPKYGIRKLPHRRHQGTEHVTSRTGQMR